MPARTSRPRPDPQAALRDAISLHTAGRLEEAVAAYRRILKRHPRECACWSNLEMALRPGTRARPTCARRLADLLVNRGRLDAALAACDAALACEPDHAEARFQRARASFLAGDYAAA